VDLPLHVTSKTNNPVVEDIVDVKDFKKLLRTKTNVLVCYVNSFKKATQQLKVFREVAQLVKGQGTMVLIDCGGEAKKLCKKMKVPSDVGYVLKHYKDGEYHKDYDRKEVAASMINFMRDPSGDIPWDEDDAGKDVHHIPDLPVSSNLVVEA